MPFNFYRSLIRCLENRRTGLWSVIWFGLLLSTGCTALRFPNSSANAILEPQVASTSPGVYAIAGRTNFPDKTRLTVAAIRYLNLDRAIVSQPHLKATYAVLDYRSVEVDDGAWRTTLNLWETAADGRYQENWQLDQKNLGVAFNPNANVIFLVTLAPAEALAQVEQLLSEQDLKLDKGLVRITGEGQRYVQASQTLAIALPNDKTTPPVPRPEDENAGWGPRYLIPQEPQNPTQLKPENTRITNAPYTPEELLQ